MKKILTLTLAASLVLSMVTFASADVLTSSTPVEIVAYKEGITIAEAYKLRGDITFGQLAQARGYLEEFQSTNLQNKIVILDKMLDEGNITATERDEILKVIENCDLSNPTKSKIGKEYNLRFGQGNRARSEKGVSNGLGYGNVKNEIGRQRNRR